MEEEKDEVSLELKKPPKTDSDDNDESENDDKNDDDDNDTVGQVEQTGAITRRVMSQLSTLLIISTQY